MECNFVNLRLNESPVVYSYDLELFVLLGVHKEAEIASEL